VAHPSHLRKVEARELDRALATVEEVLGEDSGTREALEIARRDVVGRGDANFRRAILTGTLARVVAKQEERITALEKQVAKPQRQARAKAS
jgi:hypothetical protein